MLATSDSHTSSSSSPKLPLRRPTAAGDDFQKSEDFLLCHQGWLKKQSGAFRRWRRRYFILAENGIMSYYEREDLVKHCGSFNVLHHDVEVPETVKDDNAPEMDKYDFILKSNDPQAKMCECVLSAFTDCERKLWIDALKRVIYRRKGGAIFGFPLKEIMTSENEVPQIVQDCCNFIRQHGLHETGIFRLSGRKKLVMDLAESYDRGAAPAKLELDHYDVHTVAGVLKKFLSELSEPLIPYDHYDRLKARGFYIYEGCEIPNVIVELQNLPRGHYILLKYLCEFLHEVATYSKVNRMNSTNLAGLFAPHILRCSDSDPNIEVSSMEIITRTLDAFITHHESLFLELPKEDNDSVSLNECITRVPPQRPPAPSHYYHGSNSVKGDKSGSEHSLASSISFTPPHSLPNETALYPSLTPLQNSGSQLAGSEEDSDSDEMTMLNIRTLSNRMRQLLTDSKQLSHERDHYKKLYSDECLTSARLRKEIALYEQELHTKDRELVRLRELAGVKEHTDMSGMPCET